MCTGRRTCGAGAMFTFTDKMEAQFKETDLPFMYLTSAYDLQPNINPEDGSLSDNSKALVRYTAANSGCMAASMGCPPALIRRAAGRVSMR